MRDLWMDHVAWTRYFIVSAAAGLPDTKVTAERLLKNQADIGNAVGSIYGEKAGAALTELLRGHILTAADLVTAAKTGDKAGVDKASKAWYANADEISAFLASANPNWPKDALMHMMRMHLDQTLTEATAQLTGDYAKSVATYDEIVDHILKMADTLSAGIIAQFPQRFGKAGVDPSVVALSDTMRDLWTDHVVWTRDYIVSAVAGSPGTKVSAERLLKNQADIGKAVGSVYGDKAGSAMTELLRGHILTAADLVTAAKAGNKAGVEKASKAWYANADEISAFLASANPNWPKDAVMHMMHMHLDQTLAEATAQLTGDYAKSVSEYDGIVDHILKMADVLTSGIVAQFPDKFKSNY